MRLKPFLPLAALPLLLTACAGPDTESMVAGLKKSGMSATQARCYSDALTEVLGAEAFNQVAAHLNQGDSYDEAVKRARRKFGAEFRESLDTAKGALAACAR